MECHANIGGDFFETRVKSAIMPDTIIHIGPSAFRSCYELAKVILSKSLSRIRPQTFKDCRSLQSVTIPESVIQIDQYAFEDCVNLTSLFIPMGVASFSVRALLGCRRLEKIEVDASNLAYASFDGALYDKYLTEMLICPAAKTSLVLPETLKNINDEAFWGCSSFKTLALPARATGIDQRVFRFCKNLEAINVDDRNPMFSSSDGALYNKKVTRLLRCPAGKSSLDIPASVIFIELGALKDCRSLTTVVCQAQVPPKGYPINLNNATLYVPAGSVEAYAATETWKEVEDIRPIEGKP